MDDYRMGDVVTAEHYSGRVVTGVVDDIWIDCAGKINLELIGDDGEEANVLASDVIRLDMAA